MRGEAPGGGRGSSAIVVATRIAATAMMALSLFAITDDGVLTAAFSHCAPAATRSGGMDSRVGGGRRCGRWEKTLAPPSRLCPLDRRSMPSAQGFATGGTAGRCTVVVPRMATGDHDQRRPVEDEAKLLQPNGPIRREVIGGRMVRLRRRLRRVGGAALAALALTFGRTNSAEAAAVLQRVDKSPPPAATRGEAAGLTSEAVEEARGEIRAEVESATPDGDADLYESSSTSEGGSTTSDTATPPPRNRMTPEEFARLRRRDKSAPRLQREPTDETARLKYRQKQRVAELARRQKQMAKANKSGRRMAIPLAGGFAALAVARHVVRSRREQNFVAQNIEKFETQKREFFNVTGKSESDDDLMESLRAAAATGNVTLDDDDEEEEDDDDDGGPPPPPAPRRPPTGGAGGGRGGGPPPPPKTGGGGDSPAPPSASGGDEGGGSGDGGDSGDGGGGRDGPASDEDVKRLDNLFKK